MEVVPLEREYVIFGVKTQAWILGDVVEGEWSTNLLTAWEEMSEAMWEVMKLDRG